MIKTVIFDIGNVLLRFDNKPYIRRMVKDEATAKKVYEAVWESGYWNQLDCGHDTDEVFARMLAAGEGIENEVRVVFENIGQCMSRMDYAIPWIRRLKKKDYTVLYLSNYSEHVMRAKPEVLDFIPYMDGGIFSCHVNLVKPDVAIYRLICERYALNPKECVFLDDLEANVLAAREVGMKTVHFRDYIQGAKELDAILEADKYSLKADDL